MIIIGEGYYLQQSSSHSLVFTARSARIGETSIHSFIFIKILVIDSICTTPNESGRSTVFRFGITMHSFNHSISNWKELLNEDYGNYLHQK